MNKTGIEYLDYSWNPTKGCTLVSEGCRNCWAKGMAKRIAGMGAKGYDPADPFAVTTFPGRLDEPSKLKKPARIGVSFMGDLFHDNVPDEFIIQVFDAMRAADWHEYVLLTKRPEMAALAFEWLSISLKENLDHIRIGTSIENMDVAHDRVMWLSKVPLKHKWISLEPMVGSVDFSKINYMNKIGQITVGGESGSKARTMDVRWARAVKYYCLQHDIPFWFKQMSGRRPIPEDLQIREWFR